MSCSFFMPTPTSSTTSAFSKGLSRMNSAYNSPLITGITAEQRNIAIPAQTTPTANVIGATQPAMSLLAKAKALTRFLVDGTSLPSFLQQHGRVLTLIAGGASIAGGIYHFLHRNQNDRGKVQLAVWHIVRLIETLSDLDARMNDPQALIGDIDQEVLSMINRHLITQGEAVEVRTELKRKVWLEFDRREASKRQKTPDEEEAGSNAAEDEDVSMMDVSQDALQPSSPPPGEGGTSPQGPFAPEAYSSPTPAPSPSKVKKASQSPVVARQKAQKPASRVRDLMPIPKLATLTNNAQIGTWLSSLHEGLSPQRSPAQGTTEYRVAETRRFYGGITKNRAMRRSARDLVGLNAGVQTQSEQVEEEGREEEEEEEENEAAEAELASHVDSPVPQDPLPPSSPIQDLTPEVSTPFFDAFPKSPLDGANFSPLDEGNATPAQTPERVSSPASLGVVGPGLDEMVPSEQVQVRVEAHLEEAVVITSSEVEQANPQPQPSTPSTPPRTRGRRSRSRRTSSAAPTPGVRRSVRTTRFTGQYGL